MYSVRSWLELLIAKDEALEEGLAVRCLMHLLHRLERNEPEDRAREEKDLIEESTRAWLLSSNKCGLTKPVALAKYGSALC